jgi:hypothetical protein
MNVALTGILSAAPSTEVLALALAKTALETGRWSAIWNANWGNIKAGEQYEGLFTCITLNEVLGGRVVWFDPAGELDRKGGAVVGKVWDVPPGHPQTRMRAYRDPLEGAEEYIQFVASGRYKDAWAELLEGDAVGYVHALKVKNYFTADEATYARGVVSLQKEFIARLKSKPIEIGAPLPPSEDVRGMLAQQEANRREVQAMAIAAATESRFDSLDALRREALSEMVEIDEPDFLPEEIPTKSDRPSRA